MQNALYCADNLDVLRDHIANESVDLIYLDPPFNSKRRYSAIFKEASGEEIIFAFSDLWEWTTKTQEELKELAEHAPAKLVDLVNSFIKVFGHNSMTAYLVMMAVRLAELHRVLKPTGSLYLHCDPTSSHYLKVMLDVIFGKKNFRNEIVWKRADSHNNAKRYGRIHDIIFFYSKGDEPIWNKPYKPYTKEYIAREYCYVEKSTGRRYRLCSLLSPDPARDKTRYEFLGFTCCWRYSKEKMEELYRQGHIVQTRPGAVPSRKRYLDEMRGVPVQDIWDDILHLKGHYKERIGFPTQKPEKLLERIILASSNEGSLVLDPFCGCGTTVAVAHRLKRRWIGIDITQLAINLTQKRLENAFGLQPGQDYGIIGECENHGGTL